MAVKLVGGALLSATLQVVFDRLARREVVDYLRGKKLSDRLINNLKTVLSAVNSVLDDAEVKKNTNPNVKQWLDELQNASYDADDLLDEIESHALQSNLKAESTKSSKASKLFKYSISISVHSYDRDMKKKLEKILKRLEFLEERIYVLGLIKGVEGKPLPRSPTTSLIEEREVYGRDGDKEAIVKLLLTDDHEGRNKVSVIPIVGMGGIGKTTLAQSVYNDHAVEKHFNFKSWVCVSEEFDICKVTKTVLCAVSKSHSHSYDDTNLDLLQTKLKEGLTGKKFLIVLDDMWNEDYIDWKKMSTPFNSGAQGSKIIVTTRNKKVADIMGTIPTHYHLEHLKDEDCWKLFEKHAFEKIRDSGVCQVLEKIGRGIVKKCNGLPLAAKSLGGLLRSKDDINEWERVLKSEIWDFSYKETKILPALLLSYNYLPSQLKRCFAFCSIFPKDYEFQKSELVMLWMAENLLHQSKRDKRMEDIGDEYFNELVSTSFFQRSSKDKESFSKYSFRVKESFFVMHDLVHDLARYVSGEYCFTIEDGNSNEKATMRGRHLGIASVVSSQIFGTISESTQLRTLLPLDEYSFRNLFNEVVNDVILKLRCLRVLSLFGCTNLRQLSESIGELKHLRFLNLSKTSIKRLPNSVCTLYNLQILNLSSCGELIELPEDMHHLINLRHLDISSCFKLVEMPRQLSELKSLQTLRYFVVGKDNRTKIGELRKLSDLRGELYLSDLQNVPSAKDALEAKLMDKNNLEALHLSWDGNSNDSSHDEEVLKNLLPHTNLKRLYIYGYGGTSFPKWLGDVSFCNTVYIRLDMCKYCKFLPPLGQLPSLKTLYVDGFRAVVTVGAEFFGINGSSSARKAFSSLEFLSFNDMPVWEEWCSNEVEDDEVFPKLQELEIVGCDRLRTVDWPLNLPCLTKLRIICYSSADEVLVSSLPRTPTIRHLGLSKCKQLEVRELPQTVESIGIGGCRGVESLMKALRESQTCRLQSLYISDCSSPISLPVGCLPATLTQLEIHNCDKLEFPMHHDSLKTSLQWLSISKSCGGSLIFFPLDFFPNLNFLCFAECENLESLIVSDRLLYQQGLRCLSYLCIRGCRKFISFPNGGLHAPNLTRLIVNDCKKLKKLPEQMANLLPSLEELWIFDCPEVESFSEGGLPSNLCCLQIKNCSKLVAQRANWNLQKLQALKNFEIVGGEGVESFPEEGLLPSTLTRLTMNGLASLRRLDIKALQQLTSLTYLEITSCPQLQDLPQQKLPASLTALHINRCPILKERCQRERDKGKDWDMISHIPGIYFDHKLI